MARYTINLADGSKLRLDLVSVLEDQEPTTPSQEKWTVATVRLTCYLVSGKIPKRGQPAEAVEIDYSLAAELFARTPLSDDGKIDLKTFAQRIRLAAFDWKQIGNIDLPGATSTEV